MQDVLSHLKTSRLASFLSSRTLSRKSTRPTKSSTGTLSGTTGRGTGLWLCELQATSANYDISGGNYVLCDIQSGIYHVEACRNPIFLLGP
jgi:hypothetical protein